MASSPGTFCSCTTLPVPRHIVVGNGQTFPAIGSGSTALAIAASPLRLTNVLIAPYLIKNLTSVRALTRDNLVSVEFDPWGFSIKDLRTRMALLRCDSSGELYPLHTKPSTASSGAHQALLTAPDTELWHSRLGHLGLDSLHRILHSFGYSCSKSASHTWHACRLGKHVRLPFSESNNVASFPFQLVHCDVWTSPIFSNSG